MLQFQRYRISPRGLFLLVHPVVHRQTNKQINKYHFSDDVDQGTEFPADVEKIQNPDDKNGDDETVEDAAVADETRQQTNNEPGEEQRDDDGVNDVP